MTKQEFRHGMADVFLNLQYPFSHEDVKCFDTSGRGATFIELKDGSLYTVKFEQLEPAPEENDLKGVI